MHILIINGPNLNLLGRREPEIYGSQSFEEFLVQLRNQFPEISIDYFQSNHEGALIDRLQAAEEDADGIVFNPAGYSHTSIALADTITAINPPVVEVHISDIYQREPFRHHSYTSAPSVKTITGAGMNGYAEAIQFLQAYLQDK